MARNDGGRGMGWLGRGGLPGRDTRIDPVGGCDINNILSAPGESYVMEPGTHMGERGTSGKDDVGRRRLPPEGRWMSPRRQMATPCPYDTPLATASTRSV